MTTLYVERARVTDKKGRSGIPLSDLHLDNWPTENLVPPYLLDAYKAQRQTLEEYMAGKFQGNDNYNKPKRHYLMALSNMTEGELVAETKDKIWLAAYASNNPKSDYHWQCDACYYEWLKRRKVKVYTECLNEVKSECA